MAQLQYLEKFVSDAVEVVNFQLVRSREDVEDERETFNPLMAHQIFGETETIFGYYNLKVKIMYTAGTLQAHIGIQYDEKVEQAQSTTAVSELKVDDVIGTIASSLPEGCHFVSREDFLKELDKADKFFPFGEKLIEHKVPSTDGQEKCFEIYYCDHTIPGYLKYFHRIQTFIMWFVDAASYIDTDDPQWAFFVCYEKYKNQNGAEQYATVGYTSVYEYYAYPQHIRPRISQMLVLPPFQKLGIGTKFIETVYKYYQRNDVIDITVESPSEDFQRMKLTVDASLCIDLPKFSSENLKKGFTVEMINDAKSKFKINAKQCRKVYEVLRLYHTNIYDQNDYKSYRIEIKKRLNTVYYKHLNDIKKLEKAKIDTSFLRAQCPTKEEQLEKLQQEYEIVESEYKKIVNNLKSR